MLLPTVNSCVLTCFRGRSEKVDDPEVQVQNKILSIRAREEFV